MNNALEDTDPALQQMLLKLHKGAVAAFNAKATQAVLGLFDGWRMAPAVFIKPSDNLGWNNEGFRSLTSIKFEEYSEAWQRTMQHTYDLHAHTDSELRFTEQSYSEAEAKALHAEVAKYAVATLPEPKKAKPDDYFVMDLTTPEAASVKDTFSSGADKDETVVRWVWSFRLFRKCKGYQITAPDGQSFDVCGPNQILGYGGTKDFAAFFKWAFANTNLEESINARLGLPKHVPASERPRVPVGGQTIGTCAICQNEQVVRNGQMVLHGYQRPGHGYVVGNCFGVAYPPYELSADACVAYVPHLNALKQQYQQRLDGLNSGKIIQFVETKHNYRTGRDEQIVTKKGEPKFADMLKADIANTKMQITYIERDIVEMQRRITEWKPGTTRRVEGLPV